MKSAAIAIVRNAADIAPLTVLHHWLIGFDLVWVTDNGSSDGTYEALRALSRRLPNLRLDRDTGPFNQAGMTSAMANSLAADGFGLIVPFDADECWNLSLRQVGREFHRREANVLAAPVVNYVQSRAVLESAPGCWRHATRRVERANNPGTHISQSLGTQRLAFAELAFPSKVLVVPPAGEAMTFIKGNHRVEFAGLRMASLRTIACLHLPLRAASELRLRVIDFKDRHKPFRQTERGGWRLDYWAEMLASGRIEEEWAANSYDADGMLDVYGEKRPTILDRRLVRHLARAQRCLSALDLGGHRWPSPLRFVFKARPSRFKVPKNIEGLPAIASG
jgi:hypothetical protein